MIDFTSELPNKPIVSSRWASVRCCSCYDLASQTIIVFVEDFRLLPVLGAEIELVGQRQNGSGRC